MTAEVSTLNDLSRVRRSLEEVSEQSEIMVRVTEELVAKYSAEMDEFVRNIKGLLDKIKRGEIVNISDRQLELNTIKLPILMYYAGNGLEQLGSESDVAKARRAEEFNRILMQVDGTIPHREAVATNQTMYHQMIETIYGRAYKQLKNRMDMADRLFSALKKVLSKRMLELELAGREMQRNLPDSIRDEEDGENE